MNSTICVTLLKFVAVSAEPGTTIEVISAVDLEEVTAIMEDVAAVSADGAEDVAAEDHPVEVSIFTLFLSGE